MSFATTIGHTFTGVGSLRGYVHLHRPRPGALAPTGTATKRHRRSRSAFDINSAATEQRGELEQWRTAYMLAAPFMR